MVRFVGSSSAACKSPLTLSPVLLFVLSMIFMEENQNQLQSSPMTAQTDATSSLSCAILLNIPQDPGAMHDEYHQLPQEGQVPSDLLPFGRSSNRRVVDRTNEQCSVKWMSSKMRLMRKMLRQRAQSFRDQVQMNRTRSSNNIRNNSNNDIVRICSHCETTKTPLWRGGPKGPKSLCNACGIRQMKARRAMRAAAAGLTYLEMKQKERSDVDQTVPFKKRFKINVTPPSSQENLQFNDITMSLSNNFAFQQSFPQEERDAAILLMALSCGLVHA